MTSESTTDLGDFAVRDANARFYRALEEADLTAMFGMWVQTEDAVCAHPGRAPLTGWAQISASWEAILTSGGNPQIITSEETVTRRGAVAWVTVTENMIADGQTGAAAALNIFEHDGERWRIVVHHAAPVLAVAS